jgi:hypothetical protein
MGVTMTVEEPVSDTGSGTVTDALGLLTHPA